MKKIYSIRKIYEVEWITNPAKILKKKKIKNGSILMKILKYSNFKRAFDGSKTGVPLTKH